VTQNLISLNLSATDLSAIDDALNTLEQKLSGLIALTPEDRRGLTKMGDKSEAFCRQVLVVLSQNKGVIPPNFDLVEAQNDLANFDALRTRFARLGRLFERADDSMTALGSDVMTAALNGYGLLKVSGKAQGLDALRDAISTRFMRKSKNGAQTAGNGAATATPAA
jgi:hypothetical protein